MQLNETFPHLPLPQRHPLTSQNLDQSLFRQLQPLECGRLSRDNDEGNGPLIIDEAIEQSRLQALIQFEIRHRTAPQLQLSRSCRTSRSGTSCVLVVRTRCPLPEYASSPILCHSV